MGTKVGADMGQKLKILALGGEQDKYGSKADSLGVVQPF